MPDIFLEFGINSEGEYIHISQVGRGKSALFCPYCGVGLIARKGEKVSAHFAHDGDTCNQASRAFDVIALPYFDRFFVGISGKVLERLKQWVADADKNGYGLEDTQLSKHGLIQYRFTGRRGVYELTHKGKVVLGELSLDLFNKFQEPLIEARHSELLERARIAQGTPARIARLAEIEDDEKRIRAIPTTDFEQWRAHDKALRALDTERDTLRSFDNGLDFDTALTDLQLYRVQWRRILTNTLYFLEVQHTGGILHKIGVTARPITERLPEITADLTSLFPDARIKVLDTFAYRGNVELYFKYRYAAARAEAGNLTEYFSFENLKSVLLDLHRMQRKDTLTDLESEILRGDPTPIEREIEASQIEQKRREAIRAGLARSAGKGQAIGRPRENILDTDYAQRVIVALDSGLSLRDAAKQAGVSVNTVVKVRDARKS